MTNRLFMLLSGIVLILGGIFAALSPFAASLAVTLIVGVTLIVAGVFHVIDAVRESEDRVWNAVFGVLSVLLGLSFMVNPLGGMLSITVVLGALFFASGAMQLYMAYLRRGRKGTIWLVLSGLLSVVLAIVIAFNIFAAAATLPGFVLAIELISTGVALLVLRSSVPPEASLQAGSASDQPQA